MKQEERYRWIQSILYTSVVFLFFALYLFLRRGYYNLYIFNKVLGSTAVVIAGLTLIIGPLSKNYPIWTRLMTIRRHLGLVAFGLALSHVVASLTLQSRFPFPSWYQRELVPVLAGLVAIGIWVHMVSISRNSKIQAMGSAVWKKRLSLAGKISFFAIFLHVVVMKYNGWIRWLQGKTQQSPELANPWYAPASLFVFLFMVGVLVYRLFVDRKKSP